MNKTPKLLLSTLLIGLLCLALFAIVIIQEKVSFHPATDFDDLEISIISSNGSKQHITPFLSDDGNYYYFLPAYAAVSTLCFDNLSKNSFVSIDELTFNAGEKIPSTLLNGSMLPIKLTLSNDSSLESSVVFMLSQNINTIFLNTESRTMEYIDQDKTHHESGSIEIINSNGEKDFSLKISEINARGNATFTTQEKKSYRIKLSQKKQLLKDAHYSNEWILLSNSFDELSIRTSLIMDAAEQFAPNLVSHGEWFDVYSNGRYIGNYYLCEKVDTIYSYLNLKDLNREYLALNDNFDSTNITFIRNDSNTAQGIIGKNPEDISGAYLIERSGAPDALELNPYFITDSGIEFVIRYPKNASLEMAEYLRRRFNEMEKAIYSEDGINKETGKSIEDYLDISSWVNKYLIEEAFADMDSPRASMFFYKNSDSIDAHIYSGPYWDYDRTIGGYNVYSYIDHPYHIGNCGLYADKLLCQPEIKKQIEDKYTGIIRPYIRYRVPGMAYDLYNTVKASIAMDETRWADNHGYYSSTSSQFEWFQHYVKERTDFLDKYYYGQNDVHTVTFLDSEGNIADIRHVKDGEFIDQIPNVTSYLQIFDGWINKDTGKPLDTSLPVFEDAVYLSSWLDPALILQNSLSRDDINIESIDIDALKAFIEVIEKERK